jgi:hypothetical protein
MISIAVDSWQGTQKQATPAILPSLRHRARCEPRKNTRTRRWTKRFAMYSQANILYSILTKEKVWNDSSAAETKSRIKRGQAPTILTDYFPADAPASVTTALLELTYELYPEQHLSASELFTGLERLLASL